MEPSTKFFNSNTHTADENVYMYTGRLVRRYKGSAGQMISKAFLRI